MPGNQRHLSAGLAATLSVLSYCKDLKARMSDIGETREITGYSEKCGSWMPNIDLTNVPLRSLEPRRLILEILVMAISRMRGIGKAARNSCLCN